MLLHCRVHHVVGGLVLAAAMTATASAGPRDVRWVARMDRAATISRETGKPILVDFWATWCEACKVMDDAVYTDPAVASAMDGVVPVRVDVDRDSSTARRYDISAIPTLVLLDAAGGELFRFTGTVERNSLLELLRELPGDIRRINELSAAAAAKRPDPVALEALARELRHASLFVASNRSYERLQQTDAARRDPAVRVRALTSMGDNSISLKRPDDAVVSYARALRDAHGLPDEPAIMLRLADAQIAGGQAKEARKTLDDLMQRFTGTAEAAAAARLAAALQDR